MTVSLENYSDIFDRLIDSDKVAQRMKSELVLCTDETYESAKRCGFIPVVVDSKKLEGMSDHTQALMIAYALGKTVYGENYFSQPLEKLLEPKVQQSEKEEDDSDSQATAQPLWNWKMKEALRTTIRMVINAGYSFGDALEGYYALGYELNPLAVKELAEYVIPPPNPHFSDFGSRHYPHFPKIETDQIPVFAGIPEDPRYAMEGTPEDFQDQQDTENQEEYAKVMKVYYLVLDQEFREKFGATPLERDPDFAKLSQVFTKLFEEKGLYTRLYRIPEDQATALKDRFDRDFLLLLDGPETQARSADETAFIMLRDYFKDTTRDPGLHITSGLTIKLDSVLKTEILTHTVKSFLDASYRLSAFLEDSKELSVRDKLEVIQIALSQKKVKLSSEEEQKLMAIGINLQKQNTPADPKKLGEQPKGNGPKGNTENNKGGI